MLSSSLAGCPSSLFLGQLCSSSLLHTSLCIRPLGCSHLAGHYGNCSFLTSGSLTLSLGLYTLGTVTISWTLLNSALCHLPYHSPWSTKEPPPNFLVILFPSQRIPNSCGKDMSFGSSCGTNLLGGLLVLLYTCILAGPLPGSRQGWGKGPCSCNTLRVSDSLNFAPVDFSCFTLISVKSTSLSLLTFSLLTSIRQTTQTFPLCWMLAIAAIKLPRAILVACFSSTLESLPGFKSYVEEKVPSSPWVLPYPIQSYTPAPFIKNS